MAPDIIGLTEVSSVQLTECDSEPITRQERIQSFGFLLTVTRTWVIVRASANLRSFFGIDAVVAIGQTLDTLVDVETLHEVRNRMAGLSTFGGVERLYSVVLVTGYPPLDIAIHYSGDLCILEGELASANSRVDAASVVRKMVARLSSLTALDAFHRDAARQVRSLTGFDRVMIYRFASDGAGEVIAEVTNAGVESFLGLHYPAADIPTQARALYLRNSFRIIADVHAVTVPLIADTGFSAEPIDLSHALTRAVSPVHVEYLRNMKVGASLSISIIVDGQLWGLIACHHGHARLPSFVTRTAAELFGQMYSMTLEARLRAVAENQDRHGRESVACMVTAITENRALLTDAGWLQDALREMIQCDGVVVTCNGVLATSGATPPGAQLDALISWLNGLGPGKVFVTDHLASVHSSFAQDPDFLAGVLCIPISRNPGDYIMLFRGERLRDIRWAGMSAKESASLNSGERLSPRKSFAAFAESIRGRSRPFTEQEQRAAAAVRSGIIELILLGAHDVATEQASTTKRQELLIAELNHRVRNVLALIRGLISQTHGEGGDAASYVQSLNGRVQALARAHDRVTRQNWGPAPFNAIFDDEIAAYVPTRRERFVISGPLIMLEPQAYSTLSLVVHELVTNSLKYGALSDGGRVKVNLTVVTGEGLWFNWREVDGPPVKTPTRRGFGSVIIERVVPFDLQGVVSVSYLPTGFEAQFFVPERYLAMAAASALDTPSIARSTLLLPSSPGLGLKPLNGLKVLLLEDNLIVALEAEDLLSELGATSVITVSSVAAAQIVLRDTVVQFAVLDINLGFETSLGIAASLRFSHTPFVFASGYGEEKAIGESRIAEFIVSKPYDRESLYAAIAITFARL